MSVSLPDRTGQVGNDGPVYQGMPGEVPECGRMGCTRYNVAHSHPELGQGDRIVVEPKEATAPGWAYANPAPSGTVVEVDGYRAVVDLDTGGRQAVSVHNLIKRATWLRRPTQDRRKIPTMGRSHKPLVGVEEPELPL